MGVIDFGNHELFHTCFTAAPGANGEQTLTIEYPGEGSWSEITGCKTAAANMAAFDAMAAWKPPEPYLDERPIPDIDWRAFYDRYEYWIRIAAGLAVLGVVW